MRMYDLIEKKRDGKKLNDAEIMYFVKGFSDGFITDYQASAFLMAVYIKGMDMEETFSLTMAMAESGEKLNLSAIRGTVVDKHSTGGVGDKVSLVVMPVAAACGVPVAKLSGRGLGHTGGTIDKLESIPGFKTNLTKDEFIGYVKKIGIAISGQTGNIAPADKKIYALRDVTATVNSIPLIASSIMSKKIAAGAQKILLDIKTGTGAFMKSIDEALELGRIMIEIGKKAGREVAAFLTDMDSPLGLAAGNSIEVIEAVETLKGGGPKDLQTITVEMAAKIIEMSQGEDIENCRQRVRECMMNGKALDKLMQLIDNQGGNPDIVNNTQLFKQSLHKVDVLSEKDGYIESMKTDMIGKVSVILGAGRETKDSIVDHSAGIILKKKAGSLVKKGELLAELYSDDSEKLEKGRNLMRECFIYTERQVHLRPLILAYMDSSRILRYAE